jgi:cytochrome P450
MSFPADDPFRAAREASGVLPTSFQGRPVPMILRHRDVRAAAADWKRFSSDAPFRVPIPSEEDVRSVRQLPIETDPPDHSDYRRIAEPFFNRAKDPAVIAAVERLIAALIESAVQREGAVEVVRELALPLQSRALAHLLAVPEDEAEEWIGWGTHVFRDGADGEARGAALERYIHGRLDRAQAQPGPDFFSALLRATFRGRPLTRAEQVGFVNLTFAGGRDTIIQTVASIIGYFAGCPAALAELRARPEWVQPAAEEFLRLLSPLTHIGRVCPQATEVHGVPVAAGERVSLCWASANRDSTVFPEPDAVRLDRKPNPHIAFGSGPHTCLGALHTRLLVRTLLRELAARVERIDLVEATPHVEREAHYQRRAGYDALWARLVARGEEPVSDPGGAAAGDAA